MRGMLSLRPLAPSFKFSYSPSPALLNGLKQKETKSISFNKMMMMSPLSSYSTTNNNHEVNVRRLWKETEGERLYSLFSPFVLSMAAGNLPQQSFKHYTAQDQYYLQAYVTACDLCINCTDDNDVKGKFESLRSGAQKALDHRDSVLKEIGIKRSEEGPTDTTTKYMKFLIETASGTVEEIKKISVEKSKIPEFTLSAMTPCSTLYPFLGRKLQGTMVLPNPYKTWIESNASAHAQVHAREIEDFVEVFSMNMTAEEHDAVKKLYKHAMKHEFEFFQSQPLTTEVIVPLRENLNRNDRKLMIYIDANAILAGDTYVTSSSWDNIFPSQILRCAGDFPLNYKGIQLTYEALQTTVKSMEDIEKNVTATIGQHVTLQRYGINFFNKVLRNEEQNISIQVNPSGDMELPKHDDDKKLTTYIGSSVDDLPNLLKADIGIVVGENSDLIEKAREEGVSFLPLFEGVVNNQRRHYVDGNCLSAWKAKPDILYSISSWAEIDAFIMGGSSDGVILQ